MEMFADSLTPLDAATIKEALQLSMFPEALKIKLIGILSRYGCRKIPTPEILKQQLVQIAKYQFLMKPMAAITTIRSGIPPSELSFWQSMSIEDFYSLYLVLSATPKKILAIIAEPNDMNTCQERIFGYLQIFIGNMKTEEARHFLRFVTGSSVLIGTQLTITFNNLTGLSRSSSLSPLVWSYVLS